MKTKAPDDDIAAVGQHIDSLLVEIWHRYGGDLGDGQTAYSGNDTGAQIKAVSWPKIGQ
jgi:hypothetical protein